MNKTKESLKNKLGIERRVKNLTCPVLLFATACLGLTSCKTPTRPEIEANLWLTNAPIPQEICEREPALKDYGLYRKLNSNELEFISFCEPEVRHWLSIHERDLKNLLDKYVPEPNKPKLELNKPKLDNKRGG